jgi:aryl-alcohol dehydrogenase-like predicted oxidoreductase
MRYRPFARTGIAVSALSLALDGTGDEGAASDWRDLVHAAFEEGVNAFELIRPSSALLKGFAEGISAVDRKLIFVALRIDASVEGPQLQAWVESQIEQAGVGEFNLLAVEAHAVEGEGVVQAMRRLKDVALVGQLAIAGEGAAVAEYATSGVFDAVITPFNLLSGWRERNLIRTALERQMGVISCAPFPYELHSMIETGAAQAKPGWFKRPNPLGGVGSYAFLKTTPGWTAEQLCIGYALTEPAVATVQVEVIGRQHLAGLTDVTDRGLPSAVSAQIEMARFSAEREAGTERRASVRSA